MIGTIDSERLERANRKAYYLLKAVNKGLRTYHMLDSGDVVLIAVSGGKDSMTLLDLMHRRQHSAKEHYRIHVCHVQSDHGCGEHVPVEWLRAWCDERDIPLSTPELEISRELAETSVSPCWRCSRGRRKTLFGVAEQFGCNKLAFGHHADDVARTALMNLFYTGRLYGMEPKVTLFQGSLTVIRPLTFVEERDIVPFAQVSGYPFIGEPCPDGQGSRRAQVKGILRELEGNSRNVKRSIFSAVETYDRAVREQRRASGREELRWDRPDPEGQE